MGIFDIFKKDKSPKPKTKAERDIARYARLLENKLSQNYDRQEAIEQLSAMGTAQSSEALLKRFNWSMDPSITDQEEKEAAARGIAAAGQAALDPIRRYCKRAESLTWALKVLKDIVPEDDRVEELLALLDQFDTEYVRNPEPKIQLITMLEEYPSDEVRIAVEPFLTDIAEPVRFAAVTTVFAMNDEQSVSSLVEALAEEESLRVRNRIAQGFVEKSWRLDEPLRAKAAEHWPEGFVMKADGSITHR